MLLCVLVVSLVSRTGVAGAASRPAVEERSAAVSGSRTFRLERPATHVALYWRGAREAAVRVTFSRDGRRFGRWQQVGLDEAAEARPGRLTYGSMMVARGARAVRVSSDRPLSRLTVLSLRDRGGRRAATSANVSPSQVVSRAGWGANESLRFDSTGKELWPPAFYPVQKLVVHHTAGRNDDPDPVATIRSIYYYHTVTQGWGDIGYNFLVDESGRVYEGRYSRPYAAGEQITGEDVAGNGVTAAHAQGYNSGTVGVALLGTLTNQDATPAARSALEQFLAWKSEAHGIDPLGSSLYTNPGSGTQKTFPNIAGHRDVNATDCPGGVFYSTLPSLRQTVAGRIAPAPGFSLSVSPTSMTVVRGGSASYTVSVAPDTDFTASVALSVSGVPAGASASFTPPILTAGSSMLTVTTSAKKTPAGKSTLTITGTGGGVSRSATATLEVTRR
jgi:hypothetical protein